MDLAEFHYKKLYEWFLSWTNSLEKTEIQNQENRREHRILIFFYGYSLVHTIRPLLVGRALRQRGYEVIFAGRGAQCQRVKAEGFVTYDVETMPLDRMDIYLAKGNYGYYDMAWIDRCVQAERVLISQIEPSLVVADCRPTLRITAAINQVDLALIEAAYNVPNYPFPIQLPDYFKTSSGLFNDYLEQRIGRPRSYNLAYLLADVPQFHPLGKDIPSYCHYVGPLIEEEASEGCSVPVLTEPGWNRKQPLIYLNCGSTGLRLDFLAHTLSAFTPLPYRLLVTTAGHWSGTSPSPNIRIVDYMPARQIMSKAALFIGIGGIDSIYHALRAGVPIIGAPEHLDQEYHLNRVRDLGLGLKLQRYQFVQPEELIRCVQSLFDRYQDFQQRCKKFSRYVQKWRSGETAADVIDRIVINRTRPRHIKAENLVSEDEFIKHLYPLYSIRDDFSKPVIQAMLRQACQRGLPYIQDGHLLWFDKIDSWNWLYDHEPLFFEADYRAREQMRTHFLKIENGNLITRQSRQRFRLTYQYRIFTELCRGQHDAYLFLPYPLQTAHQCHVALDSCEPTNLRDFLIPTAGFFYGYPLCLKPQKEPMDFSYTCEVEVYTLPTDKKPVPSLSNSEFRKFTHVLQKEKLLSNKMVRDFFDKLDLDDGLSDIEKAYDIYKTLARSRRFKKTQERCQCLSCSTQLILKDGEGGHCLTLARTFITLCRLLNIPSREVTGAIAVSPVDENCFEVCTYNQIIFGHTWAELYLPERGWLPVEFHSICLNDMAMTNDNVADKAMRNRIHEYSDAFLDFYFGQLDCYRVLCSQSVKDIPQLYVQRPGIGNSTQSVEDLTYQCRLHFECL